MFYRLALGYISIISLVSCSVRYPIMTPIKKLVALAKSLGYNAASVLDFAIAQQKAEWEYREAQQM